jgi:hypothetical protein
MGQQSKWDWPELRVDERHEWHCAEAEKKLLQSDQNRLHVLSATPLQIVRVYQESIQLMAAGKLAIF